MLIPAESQAPMDVQIPRKDVTEMEQNKVTNNADGLEMNRKKWMGILSRTHPQCLQDALAGLGSLPEYVYLRTPETGMIMIRGKADGTGQQFNLGEMTMTRCSIKTGAHLVGHGYVIGRDKRHAELAAFYDALLQSDEYGPTILREILSPLQAEIEKKWRTQAQKTAATKVDFFTMVRGEN